MLLLALVVVNCDAGWLVRCNFAIFGLQLDSLPYNSFTGVKLEPATAILSSTDSNVHVGASKCIDGNTEGPDEGFHHGARADYCLTQNEPMPWIAIDYGTTVTVQKVEIFNRRAERFKLRIRNIFVRISDELPTSGSQMFSGGTLLGHFAGPATNRTRQRRT